ncbi:MAG: 16S rRNA (adenine(1518)-N(6)/adenine(1519)-N(6))-dimethyltransferase RsmA [Candidatus Helarchaeota archaeon]
MYSQIRSILKSNGIKLSKLKSQHFLINKDILLKEVEAGNLVSNDRVIEIGAGIGNLTRILAEKVKHVTAIEIDKELVKILRKELIEYNNVEIVNENVLKLEDSIFKNKKIISNPPYNISSPLLLKIIRSQYKDCVITFQLEFGQRLFAKPNSANYSRLTVRVNYNTNIKYIMNISRKNFYPIPQVDSILLKIMPKTPVIHVENEDRYFYLVNKLFNHKNQLVQKVMKNRLKRMKLDRKFIDNFIEKLPYRELRVRNLDNSKIKEIFDYLNEYNTELKEYWNI